MQGVASSKTIINRFSMVATVVSLLAVLLCWWPWLPIPIHGFLRLEPIVVVSAIMAGILIADVIALGLTLWSHRWRMVAFLVLAAVLLGLTLHRYVSTSLAYYHRLDAFRQSRNAS